MLAGSRVPTTPAPIAALLPHSHADLKEHKWEESQHILGKADRESGTAEPEVEENSSGAGGRGSRWGGPGGQPYPLMSPHAGLLGQSLAFVYLFGIFLQEQDPESPQLEDLLEEEVRAFPSVTEISQGGLSGPVLLDPECAADTWSRVILWGGASGWTKPYLEPLRAFGVKLCFLGPKLGHPGPSSPNGRDAQGMRGPDRR